MGTPINVLLIEDSDDDEALVLRTLRRGGYDVNSVRVETADELTEQLECCPWDIIISDYSLPTFNAPAALKVVQESEHDIPFIIVSGTVGEETAVAAMKAGAYDFFPKDKLTRLASAVEREIREAQHRRERRAAEDELRQAEERFAKAFHAGPIAISITTLNEGVFLDINERFAKLFGYAYDEIIGQEVLALDLWEDATDREKLVEILKKDRTVHNAELRFHTQSGELRDCLASFEQITVNNQACVLTMYADITERKQAELALQHNTALVRLLQEVTNAANQATEVDTILQYAVDRICDFAEWPLGHVYMRTRGEQVQLISTPVWHSAEPGHFSTFREVSNKVRFTEVSTDLVYRVFASRQPEWMSNFSDELRFQRVKEAKEAGIEATYAFPILAQQEVVAVMEFFATHPEEPDQSLLNTIAHIGAQVGRVIEREQAQEELRALYNATSYLFNADNVRELGQQIVQGVITEFAQVDCGLILRDSRQSQLVRLARSGDYEVFTNVPLEVDGPGLVPQAVRTGEVIYAPDVQKVETYAANFPFTRSEMVVPLRTRKGILGVLDLQSPEPDHFSKSDQRVLVAFAERVAAAIEIMQLYEEVNEYASHLERRVAERTSELVRAKERVEAILNNSSDAIILTEADGNIEQVNPNFNNHFGYDVDEVFGRNIAMIVSPQDSEPLNELFEAVVADREYRRLEVIAVRRDGSTFPADLALSVFPDRKSIGVVCSMRDISERKALEHELRASFEKQKELTELKTRFISMVSHEYRTPLASILVASGLLKDYADRLSEQKRSAQLKLIQTQVIRLTELLDDVLQVNKAETVGLQLEMEVLDLVAFCQERASEIQQMSPNHKVNFTVTGDPMPLFADRKLMVKILGNLLSNAVKYSPEENPIDFQLRFEEEQIALEVSDSGIGIPKEDQPHLFTDFQRASNVGQIQGTGLGLMIVKQAVEALGGTITFESTENVGTTFYVRIPHHGGND